MTNKMKFVLILVVLVGLDVMGAIVVAAQDKPIVFDNGPEIMVYANVIKASDGCSYRVEVSDSVDTKTHELWRIADAYSLNSQYASITADGKVGGSWTKLSVCGKDEMKNSLPCHRDAQAEAIMNELVKSVAVSQNHVGNIEIMWSWEIGTKQLITAIKE